MVESINAGLHSKPGRNPKKPEQEFGSSRSMEETFDERATTTKYLEELHEALTDKKTKAAAFLTGSTGSAAYAAQNSIYENETLSQGLDQVAQTSSQHPEASAVLATGVIAGLMYNAADELGLLSNMRQSLDPNQLTGETDSLTKLDNDWVDDGKEEYGISVDARDVANIELDPNMDDMGYAVLHEGLEDTCQNY